MNLLLVDDHALFREGLRALLLNISPEVTIYEAASVEGAIDECRSTPFRMALLDLGLSKSGGLDTLDAFRSGVPEVPVIVLSGDQEPRHIRAAIDRGAALRAVRRCLSTAARS
jgi:DNA-binding NarL/FixJ family response regulator